MSTAIVLSGGGARGAYEAGVVAGIVEVLGPDRAAAPFDVFTGTSVGAINAAYLAAHADRADMDVEGLLGRWRDLDLSRHLALDPLRLLSGPRLAQWVARARGEGDERLGRSVIDPRALEELVEAAVPYERLHANTHSGAVRALVVAALEIASARTTLFAELAEGASFPPSRDPRRHVRETRIEAPHVLASAAIPLLFPARRIEDRYYCDGGVRFNTPIAPAIRCGADRLVVISLLHPRPPPAFTGEAREHAYPSAIFLLGKVLNALLLDPVHYDLSVLARFNSLIATLEDTLEPHELERFHQVLTETRGSPYRRLETLVFRPSVDIGQMAQQHARDSRRGGIAGRLTRQLADLGANVEADLLSFILFDGEFANTLAELGRADAAGRAEEIRGFFGDVNGPLSGA